jgi:hypothetical protein
VVRELAGNGLRGLRKEDVGFGQPLGGVEQTVISAS